MRRLPIAAATAAFLLVTCLLGLTVQAQQPATGGPPAPGLVVLIDIASLIKENEHLKALTAEVQADMAKAEDALQKERLAIRQLTEELKTLKAGTPDYKAKEEEVTKRSTDLNVKFQMQRKEFMQRNAKNLYNVYREIKQEVEYFANNNNITMVLKTSNEAVDEENPDDIAREVNKPTIWNNDRLDITQYIRQQLRNRYGQLNRTAQPGVPGAPARQGVPLPVQR